MSITPDTSVKIEQNPTSSGRGYETWYDRLGEAWITAAPQAILEDTPMRLQFIEQKLKGKIDGLKVLDLGIGGVGMVAEALAVKGAQVTVVDRHLRSLELAENHAKQAGLAQNFQFQQADFSQLPFPAGSFDLVYAGGVLEHTGPNLEKWLAEVKRVVKSGGTFIYNLINRSGAAKLLFLQINVKILKVDPPGHHNFEWFLPPEEIQAALGRAGLTHRQFMGLMPIKAKPLAILNILTHKGSPGGFKLGPDLSVNYLGYATKA